MARKRVAIIGSGITGAATAYFLGKSGICDILLFEKERVGGKILTVEFDGMLAEAGPDSIVLRGREQTALLSDLGMEESVMRPVARGFLYARGSLRSIPQGLMMGFPRGSIMPLIRSGALSIPSLLRASMDIVLPATHIEGDISAGELAARRFGREFKETIIDTLLGGILASNSDSISAKELIPDVFEVASRHRSLILGMRRTPARRAEEMAVVSFRTGLTSLIESLLSHTSGCELIHDSVLKIGRDNGSYTVFGSEEYSADAAVLCTSGRDASPLVSEISPGTAATLAQFGFTSVCVVLLSYRKGALRVPHGCSGFLVSPREGLMMTACTFLNSKWGIKGDRELVRCFLGRNDDTRWAGMSDSDIAERMHRELSIVLGETEHFLSFRIFRWIDAFPQYVPGHAAAVSQARQSLPAGLFLAGSSYDGVGVSACLRSAFSAAQGVQHFLGSFP